MDFKMVTAVILAAGKSQRMGKLEPLIQISGKTFLEHIVQVIRSAGLEKIIVVLGHQASDISEHCDRLGIDFQLNPDYEKGQFSSLQAAITAVDEQCKAVLVCLGDQPHIRSSWVKKILLEMRSSQANIIQPVFQGKGGHPILYRKNLFSEIVAMNVNQTARDLLARHRDTRLRFEVPENDILLDADTPKDLERIRKLFN